MYLIYCCPTFTVNGNVILQCNRPASKPSPSPLPIWQSEQWNCFFYHSKTDEAKSALRQSLAGMQAHVIFWSRKATTNYLRIGTDLHTAQPPSDNNVN
jgi:hypothetical protein